MEPKSGSFCWMELGTTDREAAKKFYSNLFGWTTEDQPMGPSETYTMFRSSGKDVGGGYQLTKEQIDAHLPPHWMLYVKVDDADASAAKAVELGAQQMVPPTDIPGNVGRFAVLADPTGAHISIFQPGQHKGITGFGDLGTLCWADLNTPDPAKAAKFYGNWLGWQYETEKNNYRHILNGGKEYMIGGIPPEMHAPPGTPAHWMAYFHVRDSKATAAKAIELGAQALMPAQLMPDVGTIGVLRDPQGAVFALYQPLQR